MVLIDDVHEVHDDRGVQSNGDEVDEVDEIDDNPMVRIIDQQHKNRPELLRI